MPLGIGPLEIVIVLVIVLIIFGPKRLPDLGRSMGKGMREFKQSVTGKDDDHEELGEGSSENVTRSESKQPAAAGDSSG
ncbi:MAG: twin-arginine translocase TatA/TatE family subunit [Actinomycetota bacterium]|nr:twin-arginine translocase TatA/TatE family subunit [Actinomycetota bacterium]